MAVVLILFGAWCYSHLGAYQMMFWDEAEYASLGRSLAHGDGYTMGGQVQRIRPPVLPASVALSILAFGRSSDEIAKVPVPIFGMLAIVAVYGVVWIECGMLPAALAAFALAFAPEFLSMSIMVLSEIPFMALYVSALAAFFLGFHRNPLWFHAGWVFFALALSTRYTALLFGPTLLLVLAYELLRDRNNVLRIVRTRTFWTASLWAVVILGAWGLRQWLVAGDPLVGVKYAANQIPTYDRGAMPWHFYLSTMPRTLSWPVLIGAVCGGLYACLKGRALGIYATIGAFVIVAWHTQYLYKEVRLASAAWPMFAIAVGFAAQAWVERTERVRRSWRLAPLAVLLLTASYTLLESEAWIDVRRIGGEPCFLDAMAHVRRSASPDEVIIGPNSPQISWYSELTTLQFPDSPVELQSALGQVGWVLIANFEPAQPDYVRPLLKTPTLAATLSGEASLFQSERCVALVAKPEWVRQQLASYDRRSSK